MRLKIRVADAAYVDKRNSDSIMFELVPMLVHEEGEEQLEGFNSDKVNIGNIPCVRQSDVLLEVHTILALKYPLIYFPPFPRVDQRTAGWGGDMLLVMLCARLERYYGRLLDRPELGNEPILHELVQNNEMVFESTVGERPSPSSSSSPSPRGTTRRFKQFLRELIYDRRSEADLLVSEIKPYEAKNLPIVLASREKTIHESIKVRLDVRKQALESLAQALSNTSHCLVKFSTLMSEFAKSFHDFTAAQILDLVNNIEEPSRVSLLLKSLESEEMGRGMEMEVEMDEERRGEKGKERIDDPSTTENGNKVQRPLRCSTYAQCFAGDPLKSLPQSERQLRRFGDWASELVSTLQPGWLKISRLLVTDPVEVLQAHDEELKGPVREYINKAILALRRFDQIAGRRMELQAQLLTLIDLDRPFNDLARLYLDLEEVLRQEYESEETFQERSEVLNKEMDLFFDQSTEELAATVISTYRRIQEVARLHHGLVSSWMDESGIPTEECPFEQ